MDYFNDHRKLFLTAFALFAALTLLVAILPAINNQNNNSALPGAEGLSEEARAGKAVYVANGCVACHTQQVRNVAMDNIWGARPSMAADYADLHRMDFWRNTATVMGTERTGPDLATIGNRQPSPEWHLLHLYQPRAVVGQSIMPAYPWLFEVKNDLQPGEAEITIPDAYRSHTQGRIVATKEALQLVAYLQTLKQVPLVDTAAVPKFLYQKAKAPVKPTPGGNNESIAEGAALDGAALYATHCQNCHQTNGEGLKGAFPPLKGSPVVLNENPELLIDVVMNGYNPREEYAVMPAVGTNANLKPEEIAAIINHERTSWGNEVRKVPVAEVKKILQFLKNNKNVKQ